ncbi:phage tail protein [Vibrio alginolyticus]|nr:phage tail protein [Vibrio alginolyticus]
MANSTDKSILTAAGKALLAQLNAEEKALVIDKMIFANVPNRPEYPQPDDVVPTDHIVHQEQVEQRGRLSADSVIYSTTLTSDVGPFDFNWTGTYCSEYGVLVTIEHNALTPKVPAEPGVAGNTLVRSVVLEYKDVAEITNITVDASSWQYNATDRMKKMDSDVAQSIIDQNGKDWFIEDGFLATPSGSAYSIKAGAGYVSGNRVAMEFDRSVQVPNKPSFIYIDAHREGTPTGEQVTLFNFVVTAEEKDDYIDYSTGKDIQHYVCKIAQVNADGSVSDLRIEPEQASKKYVMEKLVNTPTVSFIFDDGTSDHINVGNMFVDRGFRAGFAINAPQYIDVNGRVSRSQIRQLYDAGHEILNHGATHKSISQYEHDPVMVRAEINTCYDTLNALGIPVYGWVSPYSTTHKNYHYILSERHAYACTVYAPDDGSLDVRTDPMMLSRYDLDSCDIDKFKAMIDSIIESRKHVCIYAHKVTDSVLLTPQVLSEMLDYCKLKVESEELSVVTTSQQVKTVIGASNQGFMQICEPIETGVALWEANNKDATNVDKTDDDTLIATTTSDDSLIWPVFPDESLKIDYQPITFSLEIMANNVVLSLGMHFYNDAGDIISGKSFETSELTIENGKARRYSINLTLPPNAKQVRPFLRIPKNSNVTVKKPRLKIGNDCSQSGKKKTTNSKIFNVNRDKLLLPGQTIPKGGAYTGVKLPDFTNEYFTIINGKGIKALKDIQVSFNLYAAWTDNQAIPTGMGMVFMKNPHANNSRHAMGSIVMRDGEGGNMALSSIVNMVKGHVVEFDVSHYCDGDIEIPESNALCALDVMVFNAC